VWNVVEDLRGCETDIVPITLTGGRVTAGFRSALFAAAGRSGVSVNEYVLSAVGEKLTRAGVPFPGVFSPADARNAGRSSSLSTGGGRLVALDIGGGFIAENLALAYHEARGDKTLFDHCLGLMLADIEARA
jgi:hypothetical protein